MVFEIIIGIISVVLIATSQLLFKSAASSSSKRAGLLGYLLHPQILLGLTLNGIAAVCWIIALRKLEISYLYPILSVNYLLVPLGARCVFGEKISRRRLGAIAVICIGVFICLVGGRPA